MKTKIQCLIAVVALISAGWLGAVSTPVCHAQDTADYCDNNPPPPPPPRRPASVAAVRG